MLCSTSLPNELHAGPGGSQSFARYAICYAPEPDSPLDRLGRSWFGDAPLSAPDRDGLYATLLAPFALCQGFGPDALQARLKSFAARRKPLRTGPLSLLPFQQALALCPAERNPALDWLPPNASPPSTASAPLWKRMSAPGGCWQTL